MLSVFANPVVGYIAPKGPHDGTFHVTSTFAEHVASGRGPGVDMGNGACGAPIFAVASGTVSLAGLLGGAKVVRIAHAGGYESGYAHLASIKVVKGQSVKYGQQIGTLGTTGATACHLHLGMKLNGVEIDSWPLLIQNISVAAQVKAAVAALNAKITNAKEALK